MDAVHIVVGVSVATRLHLGKGMLYVTSSDTLKTSMSATSWDAKSRRVAMVESPDTTVMSSKRSS